MKTGKIVISFLCALAAFTSAFAQDSLNVSRVGQIIVSSNFEQMALQNNHAYFSRGSDRKFYDVDVSNPAAPFIADSCTIGNSGETPGYETFLHGNYAYIPSEMAIVDLNQMTQVYFDTTGQEFRLGAMAITGDTAYAIGCDSTWSNLIFKVLGFQGYLPYEIGHCDFPPFYIREIVVQGNYAYVACDLYGLQIVDITDPSHPVLAGWTCTPGYAWGLAVQGNYIYMAETYAGLRVIDVSDPNAPHQVGTCNLSGEAFGVKVNGDLAFVADAYNGGLRIVNISSPTAPVEVGWYDTPGCAHSLVINGNLAYVADEPYLGIYNFQAALNVLPSSPPPSEAAFSLSPACPNPFNPSTVISYELRAASEVSLKVYDTAGRFVETLIDGRQSGGSHQAVFDGSNFSSGIYLYRLTAGTNAATGKMALVK